MIALLALDTSAGSTGVAVAVDGVVRSVSTIVKPYGHSDTLFAQIDEALREAGLAREALSAVAVTRGPGSFTGLRVGVATAKGEAQSILVVAQGQAQANDALSKSITPILVQYKGIEKWNGILPQVSGGAVPFIELGKMGGSPGGSEGLKK